MQSRPPQPTSEPSAAAKEAETAQHLQEAQRLLRNGALEQAEEFSVQAVRNQPANWKALYLLGRVLLARGKFEDAIHRIHAALKLNGTQPEMWFSLGNGYAQLHQHEAAYEAYKRAVAGAVENMAVHFNIGLMCRHLHRFAEAEAAFQVVLRAHPHHVEAWRNLGIVYKALGRSTDALKAYANALRVDNANPLLHNNAANTFRAMGKPEEAEAAYYEAIRLNPDFAEAHRHLSEVRKYQRQEDAHIRQMEALFGREDLPPEPRMQLGFALAKAYQDVGLEDKSWARLKEANRLKRAQYHYDSNEMQTWFDAIATTYSAEVVRSTCPNDAKPIFIVGMPRSGTTLVEQIVASHPQIYGAGELEELRMLVQRFWPRWQGDMYPARAAHLSAERKAALAQEYLRMQSQYLPPGAVRATDKMPGNFRFIGLIHQLFPQARIVHCTRDPMDTCLSTYRHYFTGSHPYAYDLQELGEYYRMYQQLMAHWRNVLPDGVMLDIAYEELVADQQFHTRRLLDFCHLSWDDACLAFHQTQRPVHTASAMQVRQPIHGQAIGKWKQYAGHLQPLMDALNQ